jgi:hypothetical protein
MTRFGILFLIAFAFSFSSFSQNGNSKKEKWTALFDGKNLAHWKSYNKEKLSDQWKIQGNELVLTGKGAGDLITKKEYQNFELELEWKISEGGNSGIFFCVIEDPKYKNTYDTGPEMQILDDERHPDANLGKNGSRKAGSLYDIIPTSVKANPAGQWNKVKIIMKDGHVQFFLNNQKNVEFQMWGEEWNKMVEDSKFKGWEAFGKSKKGHIALQDHGDEVHFRNIRIREI